MTAHTKTVKPVKVLKINLYSFDQLSDKAKQTAIEKNYDINIDYDWYNYASCEDALQAGFKIVSFDIDRREIKGEFVSSGYETATYIVGNHGKHCDTFKTSNEFINEYNNLVCKYSDGKRIDIVTDENSCEFDNDADELESEFKRELLEDYLTMLRVDYEYLTSNEAIIETIKANDYTFTIDGVMNNE